MFIINIENIKAGMQIKNYRELCELLGEPEKTSNSKKAQIAEWERYFGYERSGHKYIITEVFEKPKAKQIRVGSEYAELIESIIAGYFSGTATEEWYVAQGELLRYIGMVNVEYQAGQKANKEVAGEYAEAMNVRSITFNDFFNFSRVFLREVLYSALNSMKKREAIWYTEEYKIILNDNASRIASSEEDKRIRSIQERVLERLGFTDLTQVYRKRKHMLFFSEVNREVKTFYGWESVYQVLHIKNIALAETGNIQEAKMELNRRIADALQDKGKRQIKEAVRFANREIVDKDGNYWGSPGMSSPLDYRRVPDETGYDYEDEIMMLTERYIKIRTFGS